MTTEVQENIPHPTQATKGCSADTYLRQHGWHILARPTKGEAVWEKEGVRAIQSEAMRRARRDGK